MTFEDMKNQKLDFPARLKLIRESKSISQQTLADYIGVTRPTISGYETKGFHPSHDKLVKIAERLDVSVTYLLHGGPQDIEYMYNQYYGSKAIQAELLEHYISLNYRDKHSVLNYIQYLQQNDKTEK